MIRDEGYLRNHRLTAGSAIKSRASMLMVCSARRLQFVELLGGLAFDQDVAVVEGFEINLDDIGTCVVDPHDTERMGHH